MNSHGANGAWAAGNPNLRLVSHSKSISCASLGFFAAAGPAKASANIKSDAAMRIMTDGKKGQTDPAVHTPLAALHA